MGSYGSLWLHAPIVTTFLLMFQGYFHGVPDISAAWKTIEHKMTGLPRKQREPLREADCKQFGESIMRLLAEHESWSGAMIATGLHRSEQYSKSLALPGNACHQISLTRLEGFHEPFSPLSILQMYDLAPA